MGVAVSSSARRAIAVLAVLAVVGGFLLWRSRANALSPEAERVQAGLIAQTGYLAVDPALLPTEPGDSVRMDVAGKDGRRIGPVQSCVVTVGETLDQVSVSDCSEPFG
jgi:hypothetical protein